MLLSLWKYRPKILKGRKDSDLSNVLCRVNQHVLLTILPDSSLCLFISRVTHSFVKEYLLCKIWITFHEFFIHFIHLLTKMWSHYLNWDLASSSPKFNIDLFRLINISCLILFRWLLNSQLCAYDMIYVIIPLLNNTWSFCTD